MIKNILLFAGYALISSFGLYKIKLSNMVINQDLIIGGIFYIVGFLMWLVILKSNPLSIAFPLAAGFLIIATQIFGFFFLGEGINITKIIGILFVIIGIILIFKITN